MQNVPKTAEKHQPGSEPSSGKQRGVGAESSMGGGAAMQRRPFGRTPFSGVNGGHAGNGPSALPGRCACASPPPHQAVGQNQRRLTQNRRAQQGPTLVRSNALPIITPAVECHFFFRGQNSHSHFKFSRDGRQKPPYGFGQVLQDIPTEENQIFGCCVSLFGRWRPKRALNHQIRPLLGT